MNIVYFALVSKGIDHYRHVSFHFFLARGLTALASNMKPKRVSVSQMDFQILKMAAFGVPCQIGTRLGLCLIRKRKGKTEAVLGGHIYVQTHPNGGVIFLGDPTK